ncbi:hypothetical protein EZV62_025796 [Acer yangbiense]|uniref:Uncharacterized protein n=1 Tax=Acer yangbiense TaxID=1000413 RepID=A0A5C7GZ96_9ROSI|nr:hypothetical protein EZV62_025796 [Acer yangbiense]
MHISSPAKKSFQWQYGLHLAVSRRHLQLEENFETLSKQLDEKVEALSQQIAGMQELLRVIGERLEISDVRLHDDIKAGVQLLKPPSLIQAFEQARFQEEFITVTTRKSESRSTFNKSTLTLLGPSQTTPSLRANTAITSSSLLGPAPPGLPPYKHLTTTEQSERRAKGVVSTDDADLEDEVKDTSPIVEISLKALTGLSPQNTMRLKGSIREHDVTILMDSGSTHNFLNPTLAKQCSCKITSTDQFKVTVGNGGVISSSGKCYNVLVNIQGFQFQLDFYLLPVSGCDIVLGAEWLQSLGAIL